MASALHSDINVVVEPDRGLVLRARRALKNASFTSTGQLEQAIDVWASHWNDNPEPFVWTKTVDDIITEVKRGRATLTALDESATDHY